MVISPPKAGSLGSNPSQDSAFSRHLGLGTNTSPRKDKDEGKATGTADAEQLEDSPWEPSSSCTSIVHQPASTMTTSSERKKRVSVPPCHLTKPPHSGESSTPQYQEPNQNNDSQERFQGMMGHSVRVFGADNLCFAFQFNRSFLFLTAMIRRLKVG